MPEGPECRVMADQLRVALLNRFICGVSYDQRSKYARKVPIYQTVINGDGIEEEAISHYVEAGLANQESATGRVIDVRTKGKKIVIILDTDVYLVSSLGMEGRWSLQPLDHSNLWINIGRALPGPLRVKVVEQRLWYDDSRHFGEFEVFVGTDAINKRLKIIGPDLLDDALSGNRFITLDLWRQTARKYPKKQICAFLMDQQRFAGVGNYLKAEILYFAQIRPDRLIGELTDHELEVIRLQTLRIIAASYLQQGHTSRTYRGLDGVSGAFQVVVYNKQYDPLGNPVVKQEFGDKRTTHWVPNVQH